ncbi:hypothetical protein JTF06_02960 [Desemzia sp. RIT804]|uniref:hypothetical protein n=1 Tax=Desemzia sp. RIT 804 TaxID=2810209 RepID=UPI0019504936|nr:hypothetical protein [Desemzia sp. RIT 804]MBM6613854.1 hypothetical protein [Desemzia sp. RIT 804]
MKFLKIIDLIFYITLTNLIIYDFFPNNILSNVIPRSWNVWLMIAVIVFLLIFRHYYDMDRIESVTRQTSSFLYFLGLIIVLTLLGGTSDSGIGLTDIGMWVAAVMGIWEIFNSIRKIRTDKV